MGRGRPHPRVHLHPGPGPVVQESTRETEIAAKENLAATAAEDAKPVETR